MTPMNKERSRKTATSKPLSLLAPLLSCLLLAGCISAETNYDEMSMREDARKYYRHTINECLAKAVNGRMFIYASLSGQTATVNTTASTGNAGIAGGQTLTHTSQSQLTTTSTATGVSTLNGQGLATGLQNTANTVGSLALSPLIGATRSATFLFQGERDNTSTATGTPEVNAACYAPILQFVNYNYGDLLANKPLVKIDYKNHRPDKVVTFVKWPPGAKLRPDVDYVPESVTKYNKEVYYVPAAFKGVYFDLSMAMMTKNVMNTQTAISLAAVTLPSNIAPAKPPAADIKPKEQPYDIIEGQKRILEKLNQINSQLP
jgi:hypothetical protein